VTRRYRDTRYRTTRRLLGYDGVIHSQHRFDGAWCGCLSVGIYTGSVEAAVTCLWCIAGWQRA